MSSSEALLALHGSDASDVMHAGMSAAMQSQHYHPARPQFSGSPNFSPQGHSPHPFGPVGHQPQGSAAQPPMPDPLGPQPHGMARRPLRPGGPPSSASPQPSDSLQHQAPGLQGITAQLQAMGIQSQGSATQHLGPIGPGSVAAQGQQSTSSQQQQAALPSGLAAHPQGLARQPQAIAHPNHPNAAPIGRDVQPQQAADLPFRPTRILTRANAGQLGFEPSQRQLGLQLPQGQLEQPASNGPHAGWVLGNELFALDQAVSGPMHGTVHVSEFLFQETCYCFFDHGGWRNNPIGAGHVTRMLSISNAAPMFCMLCEELYSGLISLESCTACSIIVSSCSGRRATLWMLLHMLHCRW